MVGKGWELQALARMSDYAANNEGRGYLHRLFILRVGSFIIDFLTMRPASAMDRNASLFFAA